MRRQGLLLAEATRLLNQFLGIALKLLTPSELYPLALAIADVHQLHASYDAQYIGLAELRGCELWTDDRNLLRAVTPKRAFVKWIGDNEDDETEQ